MRKLNSIELRFPWHKLPEPQPQLHRLIRHFGVLLQGRFRSFFVLDALFLLFSLSTALTGEGEPQTLFRAMVVLPNLLLVVPTLASLIALERRAGTLDLALSVRSTEGYFFRRGLALCGFIAVQGALVLLFVEHPEVSAKFKAIVFSLLVTAVVAAIVFFWAVHLRSPGAVMVASYVSTLVLGKWIFFSPYPSRFSAGPSTYLLGLKEHDVLFVWNSLVLALATAILYLYARRRIRRPQTLL